MRPLTASARKRDEAMWLRLYRSEAHARQRGKCAYCLSPMRKPNATADHVNPISRGGRTEKDNIRAACFACNNAKRSHGHKAFSKLIGGRRVPDAPYYGIWRAWMRRRLNTRIEEAERRILALVGLEVTV